MNAKVTLDGFIKNELTIPLRQVGFKRRGAYFCLPENDIVKLIHLWKWRYNSPGEARFKLEFGFYIPMLAGAFWDRSPARVPELPTAYLSLTQSVITDKETSCEYSTHPGKFAIHDKKLLHSLTDLNTDILPFLARFHEAKELLDFVRSLPQNEFPRYDATLYLAKQTAMLCGLLGAREEATARFISIYLAIKDRDPTNESASQGIIDIAAKCQIDLAAVLASTSLSVKRKKWFEKYGWHCA